MSMIRSATVGMLAGALATLASAGTAPALGDEIQGAGSSFVAPVMNQWAEDYAKSSGIKVTYQSVGSGAGIEKIRAGEVDFGATDKPLTSDELQQAGLCQFPIVVGGVVPVVNLPGIAANQMRFSGALLADIFMGKVTSWDAPEIKALNGNLQLPTMAISVVHRSDGSGTTYNWTGFLSQASPDWRKTVGIGLTVGWPTGTGGNGNAGVAAAVKATSGTIGYVEYAFALGSNLAYGQVENMHGLFVSPGADSFQSAASTVAWRSHKDFSVLMTDAGGPDAYPISATTFILMYKAPKDAARSAAALAFFKWALEQGDQQAAALNYAALPGALVRQVEAYWASEIKIPTASN
jgi:phosphate transport system substrate-binding protein